MCFGQGTPEGVWLRIKGFQGCDFMYLCRTADIRYYLLRKNFRNKLSTLLVPYRLCFYPRVIKKVKTFWAKNAGNNRVRVVI